MSLKKSIALVVAVVIVSVVGIVVYLFTNLDAIAKRQIESYGSSLTGSTVWIESIHISPSSGEGTIRGLHVSNPPGFSSADAFTLAQIDLKIEPRSLTGSPLVINSVVVENPRLHYEVSGAKSNISAIVDNVKKSGNDDDSASDDSDPTRMVIQRLRFSKGDLEASASELFGKGVHVDLPTFSMNNVGGSGGASPSVVGSEVLKAYSTKVVLVVAATQLQKALAKETEKATSKLLPGPVGDAVGGVVGDVFKLVPGAEN